MIQGLHALVPATKEERVTASHEVAVAIYGHKGFGSVCSSSSNKHPLRQEANLTVQGLLSISVRSRH